eukprot:maker-scaffold_1-snap-gene-4.18-mRNA-1 protein AED:0.02 eAED:0.02 QI:123/1/1/1/1/1/2/65/147
MPKAASLDEIFSHVNNGEDLSGDGGILKSTYYMPKKAKEGVFPAAGEKIYAHYTGYFENRDKFDSSRDRDKIFEFTLGQGMVIKGWDKAFANMVKGEKAVLTLQPQYAYGSSGAGDAIPPNAKLVFDVELLGYESNPPSKGAPCSIS